MRHKFSTLADVYDYSTEKFAKRYASGFIEGGQTYTYSQIKEKADSLSGTLSSFGVNAEDKIAILSESMPNWTIAFFATTAFGRILVPMLPELSPTEVENILEHSESKVVFVSAKQKAKLSPERIEKLRLVICLDDFSFIKVDSKAYTCDGNVKNPNPMDIAAILYTSGTTGNAKGVMLSHRSFCWNVLEAWHNFHINRHMHFLSVLPMAHTYEMSIGMLYPFAGGARVWYIQKLPTPTILIDAMRKVRPHAMLTVPLIIEKVYRSSVVKTVAKSKFLTFLKEHFPGLLYRLVGMKLMKTFGGRLQFFGIGGSKLDPQAENFLKKAHFPYVTGYGLTETAPLICGAKPGHPVLGSTGKPAYGISVRLDNVNPATGEGELVAKGPNVMLGYYKDYERTRSVLDEDGWFHTGDLAKVDKKGRYSIMGRLKTVIIGASGENIYPEEIESVINNMNEVSDSLVIERDGHLVALVQFNDNVFDWNLEGQDKFIEDMEARTKAIVDFVNENVNKFSKIKEVVVMKEPFKKTATHKIKRYLYTKDEAKKEESKKK